MEPSREPADFARGGVAMQRAFGGGLAEGLGRQPQRFLGRSGVAGVERLGHALDGGVHAGLDQTITDLALFALAMALDGGRVIRNMRHNSIELTASAAPG